MERRTIILGTCVVGGLLGLGLMASYVYGNKPKEKKPSGGTKTKATPCSGCSGKGSNQKQQTMKQTKETPDVPLVESIHTVKDEPTKQEVLLPVADEFPLRLGSKGPRVERLKVWLLRNYGYRGQISEEFDQETEEVLERFLKITELDEDTYRRMKMEKRVHEQTIIR